MALVKDTVAIPFSSGIQPSMRARLLDPQKLIVAENCQYILDQGPQKRNGHLSRVVRTSANYPGNTVVDPSSMPVRDNFSTANPSLAPTWLYGWGIYNSAADISTVNPFEVSTQPNVGQLFGSAKRDNEVVLWDGHRIFSYAPNQDSKFGETQAGSSATAARGPSCLPVLRAETLAKIADAQIFPDGADNGVLRVAAWLDSNGTTASYSAFDSSNKSCLLQAQSISFTTPKHIRLIAVGPWFHILVSDSGANSLEMRSFHQDAPNSLTSRSLGTVDTQFDVKKIDENSFVVIRSKAGVITAHVLNSDGSTISTFTPALGGFAATAGLAIACEIDSNRNIGIAWQTTGAPVQINFATYNSAGAVVTARQAVATVAVGRHMTLSPRVIGTTLTAPVWDIFAEDTVSSVAQVRTYGVIPGGASTLLATRHRTILASHAFRVGNRNFAWAASWITGALGLQTTWFLCDSAMLPVGKHMYGQANPDFTTTFNTLPSVNWHTTSNSQPYKDRIVFHGALPYNLRVPNTNSNFVPTGVFAEPSISFYELDFLPQLRAGQAGRATYFAGAQLWSYDGAEVVESGFHMAPEGVTGVNSAGGSLSAGTYRYRVDLCHKNAQNEEVRSWSIVTAGITASASDKITLTIPTMPMTRREDAYFLIFRTEANGTVYYLANSRNPTSANFVRNNQANATVTYVDSLADSTLRAAEYHPANAGGNYLDPLPPPACEIVAAGRDRLWLAGGELAAGEVAPSRLYTTKDTPTFTPGLNIQVDRNSEPITAIGFVGEIAAVFRRTSVYTIDSDGPDNSLNGSWPQPRLGVADTGAVSSDGLALTVVGLWFQSPAGIRLLTSAGTMDRQAGLDVDPITSASKFAAAVVVPQYTQVRWYSRDVSKPAVVVDYSSNAWSLWTGLTCSGACFWPVSNLAVLARGDGYLFTESVGAYTDAGSPYETRQQTAWLHAGALGDFQRIRRFALFGKATAPVTIRIRLFYDERPFHDEEMLVVFPAGSGVSSGSIFNESVWGGTGGWGTGGAWGDDQNPSVELGSSLWFRDGVFKFRKRPHRQKCSVFSVEFSDLGATGPGFEPVVLALELAKKPGLDRIPT